MEYLKSLSFIDNCLPLVQEVPFDLPSTVFTSLSHQPFSVLLDSADATISPGKTNQFSYIAVWPFQRILLTKNGLFVNEQRMQDQELFLLLQQLAAMCPLNRHPDLPPFQGGVLGLLSYDLCQYYEPIPAAKMVDDDIPMAAIGFYDVVQAFDHRAERSWVFSSGLPYRAAEKRTYHAQQRLKQYLAQLAMSGARIKNDGVEVSTFHSNFTSQDYQKAVRRAIAYIKNGDVFEVNLSQRFEARVSSRWQDWYGLYQCVKHINPSPFSAYFDLGATKLLSSSPERFIQIYHRAVQTRPIKGTRRRGKDVVEDRQLVQDLISSAKDCAENIMIVDLMRNDLSRVCEPDSITVPVLCGHEIFSHVHHLVSVIEGRLKVGCNAFDTLKAIFPGGSITGAPKIRAMQIIAELEPHHRGPYCGSLFWADFDGDNMDSSILIRTYVVNRQTMTFHGGGAITIESNPVEEYEETLSKVAALKKALFAWAS